MELNTDNNNMNNSIYKIDNESILLDLFSQLYQSFNPDKIIIPSNQKYLKQIKKKLFSNFKINKNDEPTIVNLLQDKAAKLSNFNPDTINHFQNLYHKLLHRRTLTKRWEVLYLLNGLSNIQNIYKLLDFPENEFLQNKITNINCNISGDYILDNENKFLNCKTKNSGNIEIDPALQNNNNSFNENRIVIDTNKSTLNITEKDIVTDLLYVLVGINGKYIKYNPNKDSYVLIDGIPWEEYLYDIVYSISEVGWLYYKINKYISFYKNSDIKSLYIQSLIYSIQNEIDEYYKLISLFKKINNNDLSGKINHIPLNDSSEELKKYPKKLNLKNLFMGVISYKEKLKWLLTCCENVSKLKGSNVLSQIYSYAKYLGNKKYLNNVLNEVSKSFICFILNWIKYGEVQDPYSEFFVKINNEEIKDDEIWKEKYKFILNNIPNFVKREPIIKIFEIGKCIHFIRNYCKERYNLYNLVKVIQYIIQKYSPIINKNEKSEDDINMIIDDKEQNNIKNDEDLSTKEDNSLNDETNDTYNNIKYISEFDYGIDKDKIIFEIDSYKSLLDFILLIFSKSSNIEENQKILNISFLEEIIKNIDIIHKLINKELLRIFFQKFKLIENLESLNKYLLLGQGDMIQALMESLYNELKKPGNTIYKYVLQSVLESSINSTNARYNDKECLNKLNIKLLNPRPGDIGWDIFCLEYNISLPLSVIINNKNLIDYQKMFMLLLKIKRIEYSQEHQEWRKIMTYSHNIKNEGYDFFRKKIKTSLKFNQEIIHFIMSLHNYLTLEVLETQYKKLLKKFKTLNNLDELIIAHDEFINNIKQKCFLDNNNNNNYIIYKKIISIFEIILRFKTAHDVLIATLIQKFHEDEEERSLNEDIDENENYINYNKRIEESNKQIKFLYEEYKKKIIELIISMKEIGKDLEYLAMKLDFNYYYSFIQKEKEEKEQQLIIENLIREEKRIRYEKQKQRENLYKDNDNDDEENKNDNNNNQNEEINEEEYNINNYKYNNNYNNNINDGNNYNIIINDNNNINEDNNNNDDNNININEDNNIQNSNNNIYNHYNLNNSENNEQFNDNSIYNRYNNNEINDYNEYNNINYNNINNDNNNNENNNSNSNYYYNKYNDNNNDDDNDDDKKYSGDEGMEEDEKNDKNY